MFIIVGLKNSFGFVKHMIVPLIILGFLLLPLVLVQFTIINYKIYISKSTL